MSELSESSVESRVQLREELAFEALSAIDSLGDVRFRDVEIRLKEHIESGELNDNEIFSFRTYARNVTYSPEFRIGLDEVIARDWVRFEGSDGSLGITDAGRTTLADHYPTQ